MLRLISLSPLAQYNKSEELGRLKIDHDIKLVLIKEDKPLCSVARSVVKFHVED